VVWVSVPLPLPRAVGSSVVFLPDQGEVSVAISGKADPSSAPSPLTFLPAVSSDPVFAHVTCEAATVVVVPPGVARSVLA